LTLPVLIVSRFIQGTGAAAMMAMPLALVRDHASTGQLGRWMGVMGTMQAIGTASGPAVGGVAVAALGWRAVYLMQIPMAFAAIVLCLVYLQKSKRSPQQGDVDLLGVGVLVVGLGAVTFLLSDLAHGFDVSIVVLALIAGASLAAFLVIEANTSSPIIPLPLLRSRHFLVSLSTNAIMSLVMMGMLVVGPFFLVGGLALSTAQMGLVMSVGPISSALSGIPAGRFTEQVGAGRAVITGVWAMGIACAAMAILPYFFGLGGFIFAFILLAPSYQVFLAALNTSVMVKAAEQDRGLVAGILNFSRNFGFIVGAGAISAVFWSLSRMEIGIEDGAQPISFAMAGTFAMCSLVLLTWALLMAFARRGAT
ncbi:MAG: MFS transporter, partial [Cyanobacteria bacterium P01_C01_bin.147]